MTVEYQSYLTRREFKAQNGAAVGPLMSEADEAEARTRFQHEYEAAWDNNNMKTVYELEDLLTI